MTAAKVIDAMLGLRRPQARPLGAGPPGFAPQHPAGPDAARPTEHHQEGSSAPGDAGPGPDGSTAPPPAAGQAEAPPPRAAAIKEDSQDFYQVLEADRFADEAEIKRCYRKLVLQWHPDKHPASREEAEERIRRINNAYETLGNPVKRSGYDQMLLAIERRRNGIRLETSGIKPRVSIPKEFMLCPLGHPDKFVRVVGMGVTVQSRDDTRGMDFKTFFQLAKFSLWWLPEVNNMCRVRVQESASSGVDGGLNFNFMREGKQEGVPDADVFLDTSTDPRYAGLIAVASPFSPGAFRFEGAYWPGHYISFRAPSTIRMASLVDEERDIADFILVDFAAMYRYLTMDEVLAPAVHTSGGDVTEFVKLSDLRADLSVRTYFQTTLGCTVWNNSDFATYFEGHFDVWDFDAKRARVRMRPKEQQLAKRLLQAERQAELAQGVLCAGEELGALAPDAASKVSERLAAEPGGAATPSERRALASARGRLVAALPAVCASAGSSGAPLAALAALAASGHALIKGSAAAEGGEDGAAIVNGHTGELRQALFAETRASAERALSSAVLQRLQQAPTELTFETLPMLLALPLDWDAALPPLREALAPLLSAQLDAGALVPSLRAALAAGAGARPVAEALGRRGLSAAAGAAAVSAEGGAQVLLALAEHGLLLPDVVAALQPRVLAVLPAADLGALLAALFEQGHGPTPPSGATSSRAKPPPTDGAASPEEPLRSAVECLAKAGMAGLPPPLLLRLAVAAAKSPFLAERCLGPLADAAASTLSAWSFDDVAKLLLAVAKSKVGSTSPGVETLYDRLPDSIAPRLGEFSCQQLLRIVLAASTVTRCRSLLEAAGREATLRLSELLPAQLLVLTQGILPLGAEHPVLRQVCDFWVQLLAGEDVGGADAAGDGCVISRRRVEMEARAAVQVDQAARLAQLIAPLSPQPAGLLEAVAGAILRKPSGLSDTGRAALEAAFPGGEGPAFPSKEKLLQAVSRKQRPDGEGATDAEQRRRRDRSGDRPRREDGAREKERDRDRDRRRGDVEDTTRRRKGGEAARERSREGRDGRAEGAAARPARSRSRSSSGGRGRDRKRART